jgi:hypothetical protein
MYLEGNAYDTPFPPGGWQIVMDPNQLSGYYMQGGVLTGGIIGIGDSLTWQIGIDSGAIYTIQLFGALLARGFIIDVDIAGTKVLIGADQWSPAGITVNNQEWVVIGVDPAALGIAPGITTLTATVVGFNPAILPPPPQPGDNVAITYIAIWRTT